MSKSRNDVTGAGRSGRPRSGGAVLEALEGRRLLAGQITGLELWTAGNTKDNFIFNITDGFTFDVKAPGHNPRLDLRVATSPDNLGTPIRFEVYSGSVATRNFDLISRDVERQATYAIGANTADGQGTDLNFHGRRRGTFDDDDYTLLALNGAKSKDFVVRVQLAGQESFKQFVFKLTANDTPPPTDPVLTSVKMVNAQGNPLAGTGTGAVNLNGSTVLNGVLNKKFSLVVAGTNVARVNLNLSNDGVAAAHTERTAPFSLYGDSNSGRTFNVRSVGTPGVYTLVLDLFSNTGKLTHQEVSFRINS